MVACLRLASAPAEPATAAGVCEPVGIPFLVMRMRILGPSPNNNVDRGAIASGALRASVGGDGRARESQFVDFAIVTRSYEYAMLGLPERFE
jgi:hypothetical protein